MVLHDALHNEMTGATHESLAHYEHALGLLRLYSGDPLAAVDRAIAASPRASLFAFRPPKRAPGLAPF